MTSCYGYIRVSTQRQGERGVSLQEQKASIEEYAKRQGISIQEWFEEKETAAKSGRPVFSRMLSLLKQKKADGVVIHKIDRSARNLRDWADLGELIDAGITVHFTNESLDLKTRGGRLSADIQAVVAADYIRNLREEAKKGINGRLKQGIWPGKAPTGYLDNGEGGKVKTIDPVNGPLVRQAFERYAAGAFSLRTLSEEFEKRGLKNHVGKAPSINSWSIILNNPFYMGLLYVKRTGETFQGIHEPLITPSVFSLVQQRLRGKQQIKVRRHDYLFRGLLICGHCGNSLVGEFQFRHIYYRCHGQACRGTCLREDVLFDTLMEVFDSFDLDEQDWETLRKEIHKVKVREVHGREKTQSALKLSLGQTTDRLNRLTDALLDGHIEAELFRERKRALLEESRSVEEKLALASDETRDYVAEVEDMLEVARRASLGLEKAKPSIQRLLVKTVSSKFGGLQKSPFVEPRFPFLLLQNYASIPHGGPKHGSNRRHGNLPARHIRARKLIREMREWLENNEFAVPAELKEYLRGERILPQSKTLKE
jgi:site-specific DNA recombinase